VLSYWRLFVQNEIEHTFDLKIAKFPTITTRRISIKITFPTKYDPSLTQNFKRQN
jgi:hypothetical protein